MLTKSVHYFKHPSNAFTTRCTLKLINTSVYNIQRYNFLISCTGVRIMIFEFKPIWVRFILHKKDILNVVIQNYTKLFLKVKGNKNIKQQLK